MRKFKVLTFLSIFLLILSVVPVWAGEPKESEILTLDRAVNMALSASKTLEQSKLDVDKSWEQREKTSENYNRQLTNTYMSAQDLYISMSPTTDAYPMLLRADRNWVMKQKQMQIVRDTVITSTYSSYFAVLEAKERLDLLQAVKNKTELNKNIIRLKYDLGMITVNSLTGESLSLAKIEYEKALNDIIVAENSLKAAYIAFNQLISLPDNERPILSSSIEYKKIKKDSLDEEIRSVIENSPTLWIASETTKLTSDLRGYADTVKIGDLDARKTQLDEEKLKEATKTTVQSLYDNLNSMEENRKILQENFNIKKEASRIAALSYKLGLISRYQKISTDLAILEAENLLKKNTYDHTLLSLKFLRPWVGSGN